LFGLLFPEFFHDSFETVRRRKADFDFVLTPFNTVLSFFTDIVAVFVVFSFTDFDQPFPDFSINELFIVKNLFEVGFGVVIKLNEIKNYDDNEILEGNTKLVLLFKEMIE